MFKKIALAAIILISTQSAQAEIVITDWKTTGDRFTFVDTDTGVEWMRRSGWESLLPSVISNSGANVIANLKNLDHGWRFPTVEELITLAFNAIDKDAARNLVTSNLSLIPNAILENAYEKPFGNTRYVQDNPELDFTSLSDAFRDERYSNESANPFFYTGSGAVGIGLHATRQHTYQMINRHYNNQALQYYSFGPIMLVSDGDQTLSSTLDSSLYINNANAPINNVNSPITGLFALLGMSILGHRSRKIK